MAEGHQVAEFYMNKIQEYYTALAEEDFDFAKLVEGAERLLQESDNDSSTSETAMPLTEDFIVFGLQMILMRFLMCNPRTEPPIPLQQNNEVDNDVVVIQSKSTMLFNLVKNVHSNQERTIQYLFHAIRTNDTNMLDSCHTMRYIRHLAQWTDTIEASDFVHTLPTCYMYGLKHSRIRFLSNVTEDRYTAEDLYAPPSIGRIVFSRQTGVKPTVSHYGSDKRNVFFHLIDTIGSICQQIQRLLDRARSYHDFYYTPVQDSNICNDNPSLDGNPEAPIDLLHKEEGSYSFSFVHYVMQPSLRSSQIFDNDNLIEPISEKLWTFANKFDILMTDLVCPFTY